MWLMVLYAPNIDSIVPENQNTKLKNGHQLGGTVQ